VAKKNNKTTTNKQKQNKTEKLKTEAVYRCTKFEVKANFIS
jgi:hypothetical protein